MRTDEQVLALFGDWADRNDLVRAAVMTSSRVHPEREIDFLSDYDIELYVTDLDSFEQDDEWLNAFGPIMVRWPLKPRCTGNEGWITRLVLFKDGVRIDFQITDRTEIESDAYINGYEVLIDKDGLTKNLSPPTYSEYIITKPTEDEYNALVREFWWDATYVPKYLWRDELPFAKHMLGQAVRDEYLHTAINWYIGLQHNWSVETGVHGRWFKRYLDNETWSEYASTFVGAELEPNWQAFLNAVALFTRLAKTIGHSLGYEYPTQMEQEMMAYYSRIRSTPMNLP